MNLIRGDSSTYLSIPGRLLAKLTGFAQLLRVPNLIIVVAGVYVGAAMATDRSLQGLADAIELRLAALVAVLISAGANALNDAVDIEIDRVNRPDRPLVSGTVTSIAAIAISSILFGLGILLAARLSSAHFWLGVFVVIAMIAYNLQLKRVAVLGNITVAICVAATLLYGAVTFGRPWAASVGLLFAFLTTFAREVVKDLEDVEGDRVRGLRTLPIAATSRSAAVLATTCIALSVVLIPIPYIVLKFSGLYLLFGLLAASLLVGAAWMIVQGSTRVLYARSSLLLKLGMMAGLLALFSAHAPA